MIEITTSLPDELQLSWSSNGFASWLEDEDGIQYRPPEWVYRLVAQARLDGRNEVRRKVAEILKPELSPADPQKLCNSL
jgi:hypothetical protein